MRRAPLLFSLSALLCLSFPACGANDLPAGASPGNDDGGGSSDGGGPLEEGGTSQDGPTHGPPGPHGGPPEGGAPPDGGPCTRGKPVATALVVTATDISASGPAGGRVIVASTPTGTAAAWSASGNKIHVTPLDGSDKRAGADAVLDGDVPFGLAATAGDFALLVSRAPDYMTFVRVSTSGAPLASVNLVGGGDHTVIGTEWFGDFATTGRLVATSQGYAAYHALHRRWPDNIGHQGDTLRMLGSDGSPLGGGWGWGCSHSLDQRIVVSGSDLGPVCLSDCYPSKGIEFNWNGGEISSEPSGNCAGSSNATLGGLTPASGGGFWLTYVSSEGRATADIALVRLSATGAVTGKTWLTNDATVETAVHLGVFDGGLLAAWSAGAGGPTSFLRIDGSGKPLGAPEVVSAVPLDAQSDFLALPNGDLLYAFQAGGSLEIARVRACVPD